MTALRFETGEHQTSSASFRVLIYETLNGFCIDINSSVLGVQFASKAYGGFGYKERRCELRSVKQFCGR